MSKSGKPKDWISKSISSPGYLHRATHTPAGKDIPKSVEEKDAHSNNPHLRKAAEEAITLSKLRKK